jgi:cellulase/cellobiase CelA1
MSPAWVADTVGNSASAAAPGAGVVVTTVVPDANLSGEYSARVIIEMSGTAEPALANLRLRVNGVNKIVLPSTPGPAPTVIEIDRLKVDAGQAVDVQAIAAAAAGSIYSVTILLTRIA